MVKKTVFIALIITFSSIYGHQEAVHQYIVREAYQLIKAQTGYDIPTLYEHVGNYEIGNGQFVPGNLIVRGAYREDHEDIVFGYHGIEEAYVTATHFWEPDDGDGSKFSSGGAVFENA